METAPVSSTAFVLVNFAPAPAFGALMRTVAEGTVPEIEAPPIAILYVRWG